MRLYLETCHKYQRVGIHGAWFEGMNGLTFCIFVKGLDPANCIEFALSEDEADHLKKALMARPS